MIEKRVKHYAHGDGGNEIKVIDMYKYLL